MNRSLTGKAMSWGALASAGMAAFYLGIMFLTMPSGRDVWENFLQFKYFILAIILSFGAQIGLWVFLKKCGGEAKGKALSGAGGVTGGLAMVACCAHHVSDFFPLLGGIGAFGFFGQYQRSLLALGLSSNLLAVAYLLRRKIKMGV